MCAQTRYELEVFVRLTSYSNRIFNYFSWCMFTSFITNRILRRFFAIALSSNEQSVAKESVTKKYAIALKRTFFYCLLWVFPIVLLDTTTIVSVLIPITMVAWTAWFAISLANMKQKFEQFGLELTKNLFEAFSISLGLLFLLSIFSLAQEFWQPLISFLPYYYIRKIAALIFGTIIIGNIIYKIFIGSIKYDINDSMLAGQNEAAENYYRKALSLLNLLSTHLQSGKPTDVANYYIGIAFFEIFNRMQQLIGNSVELSTYINNANELIKEPWMKQQEADNIAISLIKIFVWYCRKPTDHLSQKSFQAINDELYCLENNTNESQHVTDTRLSVVFQEIATLLELEGESLFIPA